MSTNRVAEIERRLRQAFAPTELQVKDQSHLHAGHAGARDGKGHFDVKIVSDAFNECGRVMRHRMVYEAVGDMMDTDIHALRVTALSPSER